MNVVDIKNTGYPSFSSFCVAGGWITAENSGHFTWFLKKLKDVVFDETNGVMPKVLVIYSDVGLTGSCEDGFPEAKKPLCQVHLRRNFRAKLFTYFGKKDKYEPLEKALGYMMCSAFDNKTTGIKEAVTNDGLFEVAKDMYNKAALASSDPKKVMEYLDM